jgi:CMP-N-acetylneuraminic acid synthetase
MNKIDCFLPCRSGSKRILNKNTRKIHNFNLGLFELKLSQLLRVKQIGNIYVSTDDIKIINYLKKKNNDKIIIHKRLKKLSSSKTTTDQLIRHAYDITNSNHLLWTHVTSPFFSSKLYQDAIIKYFYFKKINKYDSLMSVYPIKNFLWSKNKPLNYKNTKIKWPFTQDIEKVFEITSSIFISSRDNYNKYKDRIGIKPYFYELDKITSVDIDWKDDFNFAEKILSANPKKYI